MFVVVNEVVDSGDGGKTAVRIEDVLYATTLLRPEAVEAGGKTSIGIANGRHGSTEMLLSDSFDDVMAAIHDTGMTVVNVEKQKVAAPDLAPNIMEALTSLMAAEAELNDQYKVRGDNQHWLIRTRTNVIDALAQLRGEA